MTSRGKEAHYLHAQRKAVYDKAITPLEVVRESNADEAASFGTSSSATSTAASSSSSLVSSSSSLSSSSPVGGNRGGGWKGMSLCRRPVWQPSTPSPVGSRNARPTQASSLSGKHHAAGLSSETVSDVEISTASRIFRALLVSRRRLRFEPSHKLYFPYEPGKQSTSAVRIRNISRTNVAFKFQTTAPKSCFMRPPTGVLLPGESIVAVVVKFIELPRSAQPNVSEVPLKRRTKDKFKIVSLKIHEDLDFTPELFEEHREHVTVEQILQVVLLDPKQSSSQLERLKLLMAEADSVPEAQSKSKDQKANSIHGISVLEEWKQRKLARQPPNKS